MLIRERRELMREWVIPLHKAIARPLGRWLRQVVANGRNRADGSGLAPWPLPLSFDYDYDKTLKDFLIGQAKNPDSPFEIHDWSIKEASPDWKDKARAGIRTPHVVIVICGEHTDTAIGVGIELKIIQEEGVDHFLLNGYSGKNGRKPTTAKPADKIYKWTWENLKLLVGGAR
ncbi:hypothetical protein [Streptomyces aureoversilis]|uniref:Thoeris protein ThsB TIR-like domain-containing protein n=1 Tax=Streptomyces aureoversilis TaxID=67277 RepID=A0ABV9ZWW1_9ACTN